MEVRASTRGKGEGQGQNQCEGAGETEAEDHGGDWVREQSESPLVMFSSSDYLLPLTVRRYHTVYLLPLTAPRYHAEETA